MAKKDSTMATLEKGKKAVFSTSANIHESLLNTSNLIIDETIATLSRAQKITAKAIKKSEPIVEKQIEIAFETAETVKGQAVKGGKRALKLLGMTKQFNKLAKKVSEIVEDIPSTEEIVDGAKHYVESAKKDVEKTFEKASATVKRATDAVENIQSSASKKAATAKKAVKGKTTKTATASVKASKKKVATASKKVSTVAKKAAPKKAAPKKSEALEITKIKGIGPSLAQRMADNGIKTIVDLQGASIETLNKVKAEAGNRYASFNAQNWIDAAKASK